MKKLVVASILVVICAGLNAQISRGGRPSLVAGEVPEILNRHMLEMPSLPLHVQRTPDLSVKQNAQPLQFAHPFQVQLTPDNSGYWSDGAGDVRIWRVAIQSKGAYSVNLIFDQYHLAPGCSLYIYNSEQTLVLGAFTHENNLTSGILATAPVPGEQVIVEYHQPTSSAKESVLRIGAVNHDYLNLYSLPIEGRRFGRSGDCNPDLTCESEEIWLEAGQSVCRLIIDGIELCTGTLVNNTRRDSTPYIITAAHCLKEEDSHESVIFTFNYQVPNCDERVEGYFLQTISGSYLRSYAETLDVALLEMSEMPSPSFRPYWAGWDRTTSPAGVATSIHHPQGDVKKVARSENSPVAASFNATSPGGNSFISDSHWRIARWSMGTTEPGSSGAALFLADGKMIGSLSGGAAHCGNPVNDYFARFNQVWDYFTEEEQQLAHWLDPDNTELMALDGENFYLEDEVIRMSNFMPDDSAGLMFQAPEEGPLSGHNSRKDRIFAESYGPFASVKLHGIYLMPAKSANMGNQTANLKIWQGLNKPESLVASLSNVLLTQLKDNLEYYWALDEPLQLNGRLWIGVELNYPSNVDSFAVYQSLYNADRSTGTAWIKDADGEWWALDQVISGTFPASFWMDVLVSDVNKLDTSIIDKKPGDFYIFPNPVVDHINFRIRNHTGFGLVEFYTPTGQLALKEAVAFLNGVGALREVRLRPGIYLIRIAIHDEYYTEKILVITG